MKTEEKTKLIFEYDLNLLNRSQAKYIAGIDEVGRGPLAGPVVTCCVIMKYDEMIAGVFDSKKVTEKNREILYDKIMENAVAVSIGMQSEKVIDELNILQATKLAMKEAYNSLSVKPDILVVDAVKNLDIPCFQMPIIKGDSTSYAVACASIIAKVTRDRLMQALDSVYPGYDFKTNKGYGTKKHIDALKNLGPCEIHRKTFLKFLN